MKIQTVLSAAGVAVLLASGSATAQSGTTGRATTAGATATAASDATRVSVIGCVQRTPSTAADNTTTIVAEGDTRYMLSNITLAGRDAVSGRDTRGTPGDVIAETVNQYRLDDSADSLIAPHVGDRVEVSGTVVPQPAGTSGRTGRPARSGASGPLLKVEHIEKISEGAATCRP
jgi:hypothetical protein